MPIYAYKCDACGHAKDVLQKMTDPLLTDCPACGKVTFKKQVTASGFQLKGTGWYATDFKGSPNTHNSAAPSTASSEAATPTAAMSSTSAAAAAAPESA